MTGFMKAQQRPVGPCSPDVSACVSAPSVLSRHNSHELVEALSWEQLMIEIPTSARLGTHVSRPTQCKGPELSRCTLLMAM